MKKNDDPYKDLANIMIRTAMRNGLQPGAVIGEVLTPPPNLVVLYNGLHLDASYFWIDEYMLQDHTRHVKGHIVSATQDRGGGSGDAAFQSHNHDIDNDYTASVIYTDTWHVGDKLAMLPVFSSDDMQTAQQYIIFARIVRLDGVVI